MIKYNTRFAPSPTGAPHLGNFRTAYFNWLAARATGGKFILRIDDTNVERSDQKYVDIIIETMDWLGLDYDDIVYQSQRIDRYKEIAEKLIASNNAVELEGGAIASFTEWFPESWEDSITGTITLTETDRDNASGLIFMKSDGMPTYHFASVIDDMDFGINHIIRGVDHISNTPKHLNIMKNIGAEIPLFSHVGLIHCHKKKLAKRDGAASMLHYRDAGYDPDAMLNFLLRLGWGPKNEGKEHKVIDREFALDLFLEGGNMRSSSANMVLNMLEAYDRKYKAKKKVWRNRDTLMEE